LETLISVDVVGDVSLNNFNVTCIGSVEVDEPAGKVPREVGGGGEIPEYTPTEPVAPVPGPQGQLPIPYQGPLDTLLTTNRMRVVGTPHPGAQRFTVNWKSADGETLFHFNTRFDQNCIVRNATVDKQYPPTSEEREGPGCPFHARDDLHKVVLLDIHGDIALDQARNATAWHHTPPKRTLQYPSPLELKYIFCGRKKLFFSEFSVFSSFNVAMAEVCICSGFSW
uniref:Galectin n=1 Tax=Meloidogyne floridensis TaxID=298350 RepID=A0A915NAP4_9BILA